MTNPTQDMKLVPDDSIGMPLTAQELMRLAQQGASVLGTTENGYRIKVSNEAMDIGREFCISILGPSVADLQIEVQLNPVERTGVVRRTFTYRPSESLPARPLLPLELGNDSLGNRTVSIDGRPLDTSGLINEMIMPLRIAVGDAPDY